MRRTLVFEVAVGLWSDGEFESSAASQPLQRLFDTQSICMVLPPMPMIEGLSAACPSLTSQMFLNL